VLKVMAGMATFEAGEATVLGAGDTAVTQMEMRVTALDTGRSIQTSVTEFYKVRDGLISSIDVFYKDTSALLAIFAQDHVAA
jgi:hypothetical protein